MPEKFLVNKAPYLRGADHGNTTQRVMLDLFIGLLPVILFAIFKNVIWVGIKGAYSSVFQLIYPLITLITAPLLSMLLEMLCLYVMHKKEIKNFKDLMLEAKNSFGAFPGLFLVLISPVYVKPWVLYISVAVGEVVGKMLFGGFGQNIFNPALIGRAFMAFAFTSEITVSVFDATMNSYMNAFEAGAFDSLAGATPLTNFSSLTEITYENVVNAFGGMMNSFLGMTPGCLGETSVLACLIGYIYMSIRKTIDFRVPLVYILTVFVIMFFGGLKVDGGLWYPLWHIMSGGLFFGAIYMATEPVTSPKTIFGRFLNALMLGVLTVLFRSIGNAPEGVATAIVTMNVFGLIINKYAVRMRVDGKLTKNEVPWLVIYGLIFVCIFVYDIVLM